MANKEESLPEKLNFGIWLRIFKYALKRVDLLVVVIVSLLLRRSTTLLSFQR